MKIGFKILTLACLGFLILVKPAFAGLREEIEARNRQIEEIQRQINEYQRQIDLVGGKARTLSGEINSLNARINKITLEIRSLQLAIEQTGAEIANTNVQIGTLKNELNLHKDALAKNLRILDQADRQNLTEILFKNERLSDFFNNLRNLEDTQNNLRATIVSVKNFKSDLEDKEAALEEKQTEFEQLRNLQQSERRNFNQEKVFKDRLLKETKGQEEKFQELVKSSQRDIQRIREQVFYLQQNGISVEDAIKFGQLAALRVGIRPGFLIAVLEVESGLGRNVGTGNWRDDLYGCYVRLGRPSRAEAEKSALLEITAKLGLNPNTLKVSKEPNYGCGGALGPAQFLPTTWLAYENEVSRLTGHNPPNPWNIEDAFMAAAVKLARGGAANGTKGGEIAATKAYISGNSACNSRICNYYANAVLNKASIIEQNL